MENELEVSNLNLDELEDDEEIQLTLTEIIELMEETWVNEKFSPEILPNKWEIVDCLLGQISYMEENLENVKSTDFKKSIHQMEVDRLRYLITSYIRTRIEKIELYCSHIIKEEEGRTERGEDLYLTENELTFAQEYAKALQDHLKKTTSFFPGLPTEDWSNQVVVPNINSFVFVKSKQEVEGVVIEDGTEEDGDLVDLNKDSQLIISYSSVANLVKRGDVHLI